MLVCIAIAAFGASRLSTPFVTLALGVSISLFAVTSLWREWPVLPERLDRPAQVMTGVASGVMGGISGVWAPPLVIYLSALRLDKEAFVRATGVLLGLGSVVLGVSYVANGLLTTRQAGLGFLLVFPALFGYGIGEKLRARLSGRAFQQTVLMFFLVMGLNLIRRAVTD